MTSPSSATWKPEIDALLNTIIYATITRDEFRDRLHTLLHAAATEARRGALEEAESAVAGCMNGYLGTPEFEGGKGLAIRNATTAIRAAIAAAKGETR